MPGTPQPQASRPVGQLSSRAVAPSLPWIGALSPCRPSKMQLGVLHGLASYGASLGGRVTIRPAGLDPRGWLCPARGCQARMGVVVGAFAAAGNRTFVLDSWASVPHLHHDPRGDLVGQYAGGDIPRLSDVKCLNGVPCGARPTVNQHQRLAHARPGHLGRHPWAKGSRPALLPQGSGRHQSLPSSR
jgi:hypothetical protein